MEQELEQVREMEQELEQVRELEQVMEKDCQELPLNMIMSVKSGFIIRSLPSKLVETSSMDSSTTVMASSTIDSCSSRASNSASLHPGMVDATMSAARAAISGLDGKSNVIWSTENI